MAGAWKIVKPDITLWNFVDAAVGVFSAGTSNNAAGFVKTIAVSSVLLLQSRIGWLEARQNLA